MHRVVDDRRSLVAVLSGLCGAAVFELVTVLATQDKSAWAASPWREDPYHTAVSLADFTVPVLALTILLRLFAWNAPGSADRAQQTVRAAGAMTALIVVTLLSEWAAVVARHPSSWETWTWVLLAGLILTSVLTVHATVLLVRCGPRLNGRESWKQDWLGDVVLLCRGIPVLRRWASPQTADWARRHAMTVFAALSVSAGAVLTASQAIGERWTDPLLIMWMLAVETAANLAFCVISNAVVGFIARPSRGRPRRIAEASLVTGCLGTVAAIAFHDTLWSTFGSGPLDSVPALVAGTFGVGLGSFLVSAALLTALKSHMNQTDRGGPTSV